MHLLAFICTEISGEHRPGCSRIHSSAEPLHAGPPNPAGAETRRHLRLQTFSLLIWRESMLASKLLILLLRQHFFLHDISNGFRMSWGEEVSVTLTSADDSGFLPSRDLCCCSCTAPPGRIPRSGSLHTSSSFAAQTRTCMKWWRWRWGTRPPAKVWSKPLGFVEAGASNSFNNSINLSRKPSTDDSIHSLKSQFHHPLRCDRENLNRDQDVLKLECLCFSLCSVWQYECLVSYICSGFICVEPPDQRPEEWGPQQADADRVTAGWYHQPRLWGRVFKIFLLFRLHSCIR